MASVQDFLDAAAAQIGKPYAWGADNPQVGFDCSGLVDWAAQTAGAPLPGRQTTETMWANLPETTDPGPGDLVLFAEPSGDISHVGICNNAGCTQMIDAPHSGATVRIDNVPGYGGNYGGLTVAGYRSVPGLTGSGGIQPASEDLSIPNPFNIPGDAMKALTGVIADVPEAFVAVLTGGKSLGEIFFRAVEIVTGAVIGSAGLVVLAVVVFRGGDGGENAGYEATVRQFRHIQHQQAVMEQQRRGEVRRSNALIRQQEVEAQHARGRVRRASAEQRLIDRQNRRNQPKPPKVGREKVSSPPSPSGVESIIPVDRTPQPQTQKARRRLESGAARPAHASTAKGSRKPTAGQLERVKAETERSVAEWQDFVTRNGGFGARRKAR